MGKKYVYLFSEGNASMRNTLGGKGAGLAEMTNIGLPVPGGFTISTEACVRYYDDNETLHPDIKEEVLVALEKFENSVGKKLGDKNNPLLLSVRSGARVSMPGMMDTVLNLGINDEIVETLAELTGNAQFAYDSYRRFIQMYSDVVIGLSKSVFERLIDKKKEEVGVKLDNELTAEDLKDLVNQFKQYYKEERGEDFPTDPRVQLMTAIEAVFRSWNNPRAIYYRQMNEIPHEWGTAVNIQMMVFGNLGDRCATGVAFSRNPSTGENKVYGEFLINAQGEDVVSGVRTPMGIEDLKEVMPHAYEEFVATAQKLEEHYKNMQDMEFTIENDKLYMLQTRNGKRTAQAALQIACDMYDEGLVTKEEALLQIEPKQLDNLLHPTFDTQVLKSLTPLARALPASPGAACGAVVFTAEDAVKWVEEKKENVILARLETSPEDIEGMHVAQGILTVRGGMTSHAAVVARGMGTCCVAGCGAIAMHEEEKYFTLNGETIKEGDYISLDGSTGNIYLGKIPTVPATISGNFGRIMEWANEFKTLGVRTNADTPRDAKQAKEFGAEGIGLCRTEHMFFEVDRIKAMREMIVARSVEQREAALAKLLPMQRGDFEGLFKEMEGAPVTIRYLDPPLHEFLPKDEAEIEEISKELNISVKELHEVIDSLHEFNPMMGHRGCRLAVTYPEIAKMQTQAVIEAALNVRKETGYNIVPEIMIPLVGDVKELEYVKEVVVTTADALIKEANSDMTYKVGTMIELPRACVNADEIATEAEFFSFGTNDLTQMSFGFSRDDAGKFIKDYTDKKIYLNDPFQRFDIEGTGKLVEIAVNKGKSVRPDIKLGVCGEHGGDPTSIEFFHNVGLTYVSCSPYRVPIARLAAAQAAIKNK